MNDVYILSIDAWRDTEGGWTWNAWYKVGTAPRAWLNYPPRKLLAAMRDAGYLSVYSKGRCTVEDDGYNLVIANRHTGAPVFALEYGGLPEVAA